MIRVNLLPVRAARKKENIRRQVSIFFLTIFFGICAMGYLAFSLNRSISDLKDNIEGAKKELQELEAITKQVKELQEKLKKLEAKMDVIQRLETNRTGSVRIMDALTDMVIAQKMWLTAFTETSGQMTLNGVALDNKTVADFMKRLERSTYFDEVNLVSSRQVAMGQDKKFKEFSITCNALILQPPQ